MSAVATLILTGDELLRGFVQDANSSHIAQSLRQDGISLGSIRFASDTIDAIERAVQSSVDELGHVDLIILTGGLGPTHDDRTTECVGRMSGRMLELRSDALECVESRLREIGRMTTAADRDVFAAGNAKQATLPEGALMLQPAGTAPGYVLDGEPAWIVLPGPPGELRHAWAQARTTHAYTALMQRSSTSTEQLLRVWGVPESHAARALAEVGHVDTSACQVTLCARNGELELSMRGSDDEQVARVRDALLTTLGDHVFAQNDERSIENIIGDMLRDRGESLAVAESCTGGQLGSMLTTLPGASAWFVGGGIVYSNRLKVQIAGVTEATLDRHGAVSHETAAELAQGIRKRCDSTYGIGVTGIAGPGGGTADKPVGTVFVGLAGPDGVEVLSLRMFGGRAAVRTRTCVASLHGFRKLLETVS